MIEKVLNEIEKQSPIDSLMIAKILTEDHQRIIGAIKSIQAHGNDVINVESKSKKDFALSEEGELVLSCGSHEFNIFHKIPVDGIRQMQLCIHPNDKIGQYSNLEVHSFVKIVYFSLKKSSL